MSESVRVRKKYLAAPPTRIVVRGASGTSVSYVPISVLDACVNLWRAGASSKTKVYMSAAARRSLKQADLSIIS